MCFRCRAHAAPAGIRLCPRHRRGDAFDGADDRIVGELEPGDLVITADIPLASRVLAGGAEALNPRGEPYTAAGIGNALAMRELLAELRITGEVTGRRTAVFGEGTRTVHECAESDADPDAEAVKRTVSGSCLPVPVYFSKKQAHVPSAACFFHSADIF